MTSFHFGAPAFLAVQFAVWLGCGLLIGAGHFLTLRWNVSSLALGRAPPVAAIVQVGRFALLVGVLAAIADCRGALPLVSAVGGILAARTVITMQLGALR
jgi:F1F0 ATPase subunit 2